MTSVIDLVKSQQLKDLEKLSRKRAKELNQKKKEFTECSEKILQLNDSVAKISGELKAKRAHEKDLRVSTSRIISHHKTVKIDRGKRPADREYIVRNYSQMDRDCWRYNQLRDWFNTYATDPEPYKYVPSEAGYMIRIDEK